MADNEHKANELVAAAEKKLNGSKGFLGGLFGGASKQDEALEMYARAGNMYKMAKKWDQAGQTFVTLAKYKFDAKNQHEAATNYVDASNCYKKCNPQEAIKCLISAIDIYTDMGRFTIAAKHHQAIGEMYQSDIVDNEKAIIHFQKSADYYQGEDSTATANKCLLRVAHIAALQENYDRAIEIFEQVGSSTLSSPLTKYSAKDHFFRASLCHLCVDMINAQHAIERYEQIMPSYESSREAALVKALAKAIEDGDVETFSGKLGEYDKISRLDDWSTKILLKIKKQIPTEDDLC